MFNTSMVQPPPLSPASPSWEAPDSLDRGVGLSLGLAGSGWGNPVVNWNPNDDKDHIAGAPKRLVKLGPYVVPPFFLSFSR